VRAANGAGSKGVQVSFLLTIIYDNRIRHIEFDSEGDATEYADNMMMGMDTSEAREVAFKIAHIHEWGPFQRSWISGTLHRPCLDVGCREVSLDGDEEDHDNDGGSE